MHLRRSPGELLQSLQLATILGLTRALGRFGSASASCGWNRWSRFPSHKWSSSNDMKVGEEEIASMAKLETEANTAAEEVLKLSEKLVSEDNAAESQTVHEAFMRVRKFAPEGPGDVLSSWYRQYGELVGWKLSESERLELQSLRPSATSVRPRCPRALRHPAPRTPRTLLACPKPAHSLAGKTTAAGPA